MKLKFTTLLAVLLLAVLAMPESAEAQADTDLANVGWDVTRGATLPSLVLGGNNQKVAPLTFSYNAAGDAANPADVFANQESATAGDPPATTLTIAFGGLAITNADASQFLWCGTNFATLCDSDTTATNPSASLKDNQITVSIPDASTDSFRVALVRLDVSGLEEKATVPVSITPGASATVPLGGGTTSGGVSGMVGMIANGLAVTAAAAEGLACATPQPLPSITVKEGFASAWSPGDDPGAPSTKNEVKIKIAVGNLPADGKIVWPKTVASEVELDLDAAGPGVKALTPVGSLAISESESSPNGQSVVYTYTRDMPDYATAAVDADGNALTGAFPHAAARTFTIPVMEHMLTGAATLSVTAQLYPQASLNTKGEKSDLATVLSFSADPEPPIKDKAVVEDWLVLADCVTHLLYPFITCGATAGWSTGISVSNTTADGNIFGAFDKTNEQMGSVMMYGFPRGRSAPAEGEMVEPVVSTVSPELMPGDTITFDCGNTTMAGMEGYAIIKANFQHARGMAFVLGNFTGGAGVDVSHGYMAEVINDPRTRTDDL